MLEVLCDECESALKFEEFEDTLRKDLLDDRRSLIPFGFLEIITVGAYPLGRTLRRVGGIAGYMHDMLSVFEPHCATAERAFASFGHAFCFTND